MFKRHLTRHGAAPQDGVTALDILIALAVLAILLALGVPALRAVAQEQRMKAAVASLHSSLVLARNAAISRNRSVVACPTESSGACADHADWHAGWLVFTDLDGDREWQAVEPVLRREIAMPRVIITSSIHRNRLRFFPGGSAPGSNASIVFCDALGTANGRRITVSASGRIRRVPSGDPDPPPCPT